MKTIKVVFRQDVPEDFTGIVEFSDETRIWYKEGKVHRKDGPAKEWRDSHKEWYLEDIFYKRINLKDYIILDYYQGNHNLMWYKLLGKDNVFDCPDIPRLIMK